MWLMAVGDRNINNQGSTETEINSHSWLTAVEKMLTGLHIQDTSSIIFFV